MVNKQVRSEYIENYMELEKAYRKESFLWCTFFDLISHSIVCLAWAYVPIFRNIFYISNITTGICLSKTSLFAQAQNQNSWFYVFDNFHRKRTFGILQIFVHHFRVRSFVSFNCTQPNWLKLILFSFYMVSRFGRGASLEKYFLYDWKRVTTIVNVILSHRHHRHLRAIDLD